MEGEAPNIITIKIRVPSPRGEKLRQDLRDAATEDSRSVNLEAVHLLEQALAARTRDAS